jgi:hypothetical protein
VEEVVEAELYSVDLKVLVIHIEVVVAAILIGIVTAAIIMVERKVEVKVFNLYAPVGANQPFETGADSPA